MERREKYAILRRSASNEHHYVQDSLAKIRLPGGSISHESGSMASCVTVVTTVYNAAEYLDQAAENILGQMQVDVTWLVVDDGSDDATPGWLREFAAREKRVRILSPGRVGRARALNMGVEAARSAYVAIQDVDDRSERLRLAHQARFLDANPDVGVVGGWYVLVNEFQGERQLRKMPTEHEALVRALARYIPFAHTTVMFRKEAWLQTGGYPLVDDFEDLLLWARMAGYGWRLANLPEVLGEHLIHAGSFWTRTYSPRTRQRRLFHTQMRAIREAKLPVWEYFYPLGRLAFSYAPRSISRLLRGSKLRRMVVERGRPLD